MTIPTLIIQESPYTKANKAWHALRLAGAALTEDMRVRIFLLERGVELARRGLPIPTDKTDLEALMTELIDCGLEVQGCGMCLDKCGLPSQELIEGVQRGPMKSLAAWIKDSTHVLGF